jgi:aldose 1-epimerase
MMRILVGVASLALIVLSLQAQKQERSKVTRQVFGKTPDGRAADLFVLTNVNGVEAAITNYGAALVWLKVPDRAGKLADVVLGYKDLDGYVGDKVFMGAVVGRYGNRIARARFTLGGVVYNLTPNNGENTLHGGPKGFYKVLWQGQKVTSREGQAVQLNYLSPDGEEGYPGNLSAEVIYTLTDRNELKIEYRATTDKETVVNLTNHSYFNLSGQGKGDILLHEVLIDADRFTPVDAALIPTGELRPVRETPFDFTKFTAIGARIAQHDPQLKIGKGYDHNWVLNSGGKGSLSLAARVYEPKTGRVLEVWTTEPGLQFYTGNFLDGTIRGKDGNVYQQRYGFCLETQHFPDSPNQPQFPSTVLKPGQEYRSTTIFKFSIR